MSEWFRRALPGALGFLAVSLAVPGSFSHELESGSPACFWVVAEADCPAGARSRFTQRMEQHLVVVEGDRTVPFPFEPGWQTLRLRFHELAFGASRRYVRPLQVDCAEALQGFRADRCAAVEPFPVAQKRVDWRAGGRAGRSVPLVGLPVTMQFALAGATQLAAEDGVAPSLPGFGFDLAVPQSWGLEVGEKVELRVGGRAEVAQVQLLYECPVGTRCPLFTDPVALASARRPSEPPARHGFPAGRVDEPQLVAPGGEPGRQLEPEGAAVVELDASLLPPG
jgi:hypothetical protein